MNILKKARGRPRKELEVQVVQVNSPQVITRREEEKPDWDETIRLTEKAVKLSGDVQVLLDDLIPKMRDLTETLRLAYEAAPEKDCGFGASPINPLKLRFAMKAYLFTKGFRIDNIYVPDVTKVPMFKDYVKESTKWLTKFSL